MIAGLIDAIYVSYDKEIYEELEKESDIINPLWLLIIISFIPILNTIILLGYIKVFFQAIYETIIEFINKDKK